MMKNENKMEIVIWRLYFNVLRFNGFFGILVLR